VPYGQLLSSAAPFYTQAQLGLARAYSMGGDKAAAKKAYAPSSSPGKMPMRICPCW